MKAILYHTETDILDIFPSFENKRNIYESLINGLKNNLSNFDLQLIHLSVEGSKKYGDINFQYSGDPNNIVFNRELFLIHFL